MLPPRDRLASDAPSPSARLAAALVLATLSSPPRLALADLPTVSPASTTTAPAASTAPRAPASRDPTDRGHWKPAWRRVGPYDYLLGSAGLIALAVEAIVLEPNGPAIHWDRPILFDNAVRDALVSLDPAVRQAANLGAWVGLGALLAYPVAVDIPIAWARGGRDLAWQFLWQDVIVLSISTAVDLGIRDATGRARPSLTDCGSNGVDCPSPNQAARSFPGGHFATTSAAAALICTQHLNTRLYGGPWDAITCGSAIAADLAVGVLRIVEDEHWATDQIAGGLIGSLIGWGLPTLLYYGRYAPRALRTPSTAPRALVVPVPVVTPRSASVALTALF